MSGRLQQTPNLVKSLKWAIDVLERVVEHNDVPGSGYMRERFFFDRQAIFIRVVAGNKRIHPKKVPKSKFPEQIQADSTSATNIKDGGFT